MVSYVRVGVVCACMLVPCVRACVHVGVVRAFRRLTCAEERRDDRLIWFGDDASTDCTALAGVEYASGAMCDAACAQEKARWCALLDSAGCRLRKAWHGRQALHGTDGEAVAFAWHIVSTS